MTGYARQGYVLQQCWLDVDAVKDPCADAVRVRYFRRGVLRANGVLGELEWVTSVELALRCGDMTCARYYERLLVAAGQEHVRVVKHEIVVAPEVVFSELEQRGLA